MKNSIITASILVLAVAVFPSPVLADVSYSWSLTCNGNGGGSWSWLQNGVAITNQTFTPNCNTSGTGTVPSNANGITASVWASVGLCVKNGYCCNFKSKSSSVTSSFDPTKGISINLNVSVQEQCSIIGVNFGKLSSSANFSLKS